MTRSRFLVWAVMVLLATNVATILSALRYSGRLKAEERSRNEALADARVTFFRDHLQLSESQMIEFGRLNREFTTNARRTTTRLDQLRRSMIEELSSPEPDIKLIDEITEEIGGLHRELKTSTARFYMGLREVSTPEQQEILREMFLVMSDPEGDIEAFRRGPMGQGPGQGGRGRNMRGQGRGMGNRF